MSSIENFRGLWKPAQIYHDPAFKDLSYAEKEMYCLINALSKKSGRCWASNGSIAKMLGMDTNFVGDCVSKLRKRGLVLWSKFKDRRLLVPTIILQTDPMEISLPSVKHGEVLRKTRRPLITKHSKTNTLSRPSDGDGIEEDKTSMPFLDELQPKLPNNVDTKRAIQLKEALKTKDLIRAKVNVKQWANQFRLLRQDVGKGVIQPILQWYCDHAGERGVPQAWSASSFRKKFDQIRNGMGRTFSKPEETVHKEYHKHTLSIYEELKHYSWPKGTKTQLLDAIQDSVLEYEAFRKGLFSLNTLTKVKQEDKSTKKGNKLERLLIELQGLVPGATTFIRNWFDNVNKSVQNWDAWSGNLRSMGMSRANKKFIAIGRGWTDDYCGEPERWDKLMELMK